LVFLLLGIAAGSEGLIGIPFDDHGLAFRLGVIALVLILFDGGLNTPLVIFRRSVRRAGVLATLGVLLTAAAVAGCCVLLGFSWRVAVLAGAVVSSTDAAAVFSVLRGSGVRLKETTGATLEVESGLNDPLAMLLTVIATEALLGTHGLGADTALELLLQLGGGIAGGIGFGLLARVLLRHANMPAAGLYPVLTTAVAFAAYGISTLAHGSGFLAVYLAAIVLASGPMPYRAGIRRVHDALAWLAQLGMFLLLGLLVFPSRLLPMALRGLALALMLAFLARPLAVLLSLLPFRLAWRERAFIAWVGLRGAVPIVLATYPVLRGVPEGPQVFDLVFFVVLVNSLLPGATVGWVARRLGLAEPHAPMPAASVELVSLREYSGQFIWYFVSRASAVAGAQVRELPLPDGCVMVLLLRGDAVIPARGEVVIQDGDHVCMFATREDRALLDLLFGREEDEPA
jgi:cell volume regulation protein A